MPSQALAQFINNQSQPQILTSYLTFRTTENSLWIEHNDKARPTSPEETEEQKSKAKYYLQFEDNCIPSGNAKYLVSNQLA